ncbi:MAG: hypothetical protein ACXABY_18320, partial [Candidatus Thorarchaeota archaeon]
MSDNYIYPFIYYKEGEGRSFVYQGIVIRECYLKWIATEDFSHVEAAVKDIALLVGWQWKKLFGGKGLDVDVLDPVTYKIIFKFMEHGLPINHSMGHYLKTLIRRNLLRLAYKTVMPLEGDKTVRAFNYRPFSVPADAENRMFLDDMKEIVLDIVEHGTRLDFRKRRACRYIAELMLQEKLPSPLVLLDKYAIPYGEQEFYLDFTRVIVRKELYKLRSSLPFLYGNEEKPFV